MTPASTGEDRRDEGCQLADAGSKVKSLKLRLQILTLAAGRAQFTADDLPRGEGSRSNRTGSAFLALSKMGLITFTGLCKPSTRASRHAGLQRLWEASDCAVCLTEAQRLQAEIDRIDPPLAQGKLFSEFSGGQE